MKITLKTVQLGNKKLKAFFQSYKQFYQKNLMLQLLY